MIDRQEELAGEGAEVKVARIKSIASKRRVLEEDSARVQREIRARFADLVETVLAREKQLLRQAEAIHRQRISVAESNEEDEDDIRPVSVRALFEGRDELTERLRAFGRIELRGTASFRITNREPYEMAEYQDSSNDHVSFDKFIAGNSGSAGGLLLESSTMLTSDAAPAAAAAAADGDGDGVGVGSPPVPVQTLDQPAEQSTAPPSSCCCCCCCCCCRRRRRRCRCRPCKGDYSPASRTCERDKTDHVGGKEVVAERETEVEDGGKEEPAEANPGVGGESRRSSDEGHPEQVRQWLEEILSETEIEPTIHEVEKLPEIYYWRKVHQVEG